MLEYEKKYQWAKIKRSINSKCEKYTTESLGKHLNLAILEEVENMQINDEIALINCTEQWQAINSLFGRKTHASCS